MNTTFPSGYNAQYLTGPRVYANQMKFGNKKGLLPTVAGGAMALLATAIPHGNSAKAQDLDTLTLRGSSILREGIDKSEPFRQAIDELGVPRNVEGLAEVLNLSLDSWLDRKLPLTDEQRSRGIRATLKPGEPFPTDVFFAFLDDDIAKKLKNTGIHFEDAGTDAFRVVHNGKRGELLGRMSWKDGSINGVGFERVGKDVMAAAKAIWDEARSLGIDPDKIKLLGTELPKQLGSHVDFNDAASIKRALANLDIANAILFADKLQSLGDKDKLLELVTDGGQAIGQEALDRLAHLPEVKRLRYLQDRSPELRIAGESWNTFTATYRSKVFWTTDPSVNKPWATFTSPSDDGCIVELAGGVASTTAKATKKTHGSGNAKLHGKPTGVEADFTSTAPTASALIECNGVTGHIGPVTLHGNYGANIVGNFPDGDAVANPAAEPVSGQLQLVGRAEMPEGFEARGMVGYKHGLRNVYITEAEVGIQPGQGRAWVDVHQKDHMQPIGSVVAAAELAKTIESTGTQFRLGAEAARDVVNSPCSGSDKKGDSKNCDWSYGFTGGVSQRILGENKGPFVSLDGFYYPEYLGEKNGGVKAMLNVPFFEPEKKKDCAPNPHRALGDPIDPACAKPGS